TRYLLEKIPETIVKGNGKTNALMIAVIQIKNQMLKSMLDKVEKNLIDERDEMGYTPLHLAIMFENIEAVHLLLKHGADPHKKTNSNLSIWDLLREIKEQKVSLYFQNL